MKNLKYLIAGVCFGFVLIKGEAVSWYRIQEMFRFESFHMFGIFMTAIPTGALALLLIRKLGIKTVEGGPIAKPVKKFHPGIILGGLTFGCGWALTGACPGPLYVLIGAGYSSTIITFIAAVAGTWTHAYFEKYLPS